MVGSSQQSMCAGVLPNQMASQYLPVVASPGMVSEVMVMEEMNPWSASKRVEALMNSPPTHVKESTDPTVPQDLSREREAWKKGKLEKLRLQSLKNAEDEFLRGRAAIQHARVG